MSFGERLREARIAKGLKQTDVATSVGVSAQAVSNWEKGVNEPNVEKASKICDLLDITADYLYGQANVDVVRDAREEEILRKYNDLSMTGRLTIENILNSLWMYEREHPV